MLRYASLILHNSLRNRRRSILTILSIGVSLCLLGVLMAVYSSFYLSDPSPAQALRLSMHHRVSITNSLPIYYRDQVKRIPGVVEMMSQNWFGGVYKDARDSRNFFARFGVEPDKLLRVHPEMTVPPDDIQAFIRDRAGCIVGRGLADKFALKVGDKVQIKGDIYPVNLDLTVRAIYDAPDNTETLYFNMDTVFEGMPAARRGQVGMFVILVDQPGSANRVAAAIDEMFKISPAETKTETEQQFQLAFLSSLGNIKAFLFAICGAVTFTILLVSGNTMAMSVRERIREVGILKTLGFTREAILAIILGEAAVISAIGGAIGVGLASLICGMARKGPDVMGQLKLMHMDPPIVAATMAAALIIGLASSFVPAYGAARTSILDALRSAG